MRSTSIHNLNADKGLNWLQKICYIFLNWLNNLFPYANIDKRIIFKKFSPPNLWDAWEKTYLSSSPSRKLSDIFWRTLPWQEMEKELGGIHVFDTGCGQGNYSLRLWDGVRSYTGIDAKRRDNWGKLEKEHPNFRFIESPSTDIAPLIPNDTNLFITQSAIEHFDNDLDFFRQIKDFDKDKKYMQIHLLPGKATLPLYLFHGVRQYTPRTISKITRVFDNAKEISLYPLGGKECKKIHFKYFTWPVLIRRRYKKATFDIEKYDKELRMAMESDSKCPNKSPLFWALIIHFHPKRQIW